MRDAATERPTRAPAPHEAAAGRAAPALARAPLTADLIRLQRQVGNRAATRMLQREGEDDTATKTKSRHRRHKKKKPLTSKQVAALAVQAARDALTGAEDAITAAAGGELDPTGASTFATGFVDAAVDQLRELLVTDTLGKVVKKALVKRDASGHTIRKGAKRTTEIDDRFADPINTELWNEIDTRISQTGGTPREEFSRLVLQAAKQKETDRLTKHTAKHGSSTTPPPPPKNKMLKAVSQKIAAMAGQEVLKDHRAVRHTARAQRGQLETAVNEAVRASLLNSIYSERNFIEQKRRLLDTLEQALAEDVADEIRETIGKQLERLVTELGESADRIDSYKQAAQQAGELAAKTRLEELRDPARQALQKRLHKRPHEVRDMRSKTRRQVKKMLKDPSLASSAIQQGVDEYAEGPLNGAIMTVVQYLAKQAKKPGSTAHTHVKVRIPVDPTASAYVGFQITADVRRLMDESLRAGMEVSLIGGAKIPGVDVELGGKLGGYFDVHVQKDTERGLDDDGGEHAGELVSYAFYRRFRESPVLPHGIADHWWGLGGKTKTGTETTSQAKRREAEAHGRMLESTFRDEEHVETGLTFGAFANAKLETGVGGLGVGGFVDVDTGSRFTKKYIEEERARGEKRLGRGVTTIKAGGNMLIGPLRAKAEFHSTMLDKPREGESRHVESELRVSAAAVTVGKAMMGDPAEVAARVAGWIAKVGFLGQEVLERGEAYEREIGSGTKFARKDAQTARKTKKTVMEPVKAASAAIGGTMADSHAAYEERQALIEQNSSVEDVGKNFSELPQDAQTDITNMRPGAVLQNLKETKMMLIDKSSGVSVDLFMHWDAEGKLTVGTVGMNEVKHTGSVLTDALRTVQVLDIANDKSKPLFTYEFAPQKKFTWLFSGMNKNTFKAAGRYWGQYVHSMADQVGATPVNRALEKAGVRKDDRHHAHHGAGQMVTKALI